MNQFLGVIASLTYAMLWTFKTSSDHENLKTVLGRKDTKIPLYDN